MKLAPLVVIAASLLSCVCSRTGSDGGDGTVDAAARDAAKGFVLAKDVAASDLAELTKAPHPFGSARQQELATWLAARAGETGATPAREAFSAATPNPAAIGPQAGPVAETTTLDGVNLYALGTIKPDAPCVVAIASHYDTKIVAGTEYAGANDSGSSSALLLQLVQYLKAQAGKVETTCDVVGVWFDGEEAVLANWTDGQTIHPAKIQDNTYGSRHAVSRLTKCDFEGAGRRCLPADLGGKPLIGLVLMDMVGSPGLLLSRETHSTAKLMDLARLGADAMGYSANMSDQPQGIEDDHVPYLKAGVPAVDLIDFHNLTYWHRPGDEASQVSLESMEIAGRIALYTALGIARQPQVFGQKTE